MQVPVRAADREQGGEVTPVPLRQRGGQPPAAGVRGSGPRGTAAPSNRRRRGRLGVRLGISLCPQSHHDGR